MEKDVSENIISKTRKQVNRHKETDLRNIQTYILMI